MTTTDKMIALTRRLKTEMNGAVAGAMREYGIGNEPENGYGINYGVSVSTIKDIVYEVVGSDPDHELAELLWKQDVRELKLAALFSEDPAEVSEEQMQQWSGGWVTLELAEQSAMQLFWKVERAMDAALQWLHTDTGEYRRLGAYYIIGKNAGDKEAMERVVHDSQVFDGRTVERSAVYALREIYRHQEGLRDSVMGILKRIPDETAEGVRWQVEYLPE